MNKSEEQTQRVERIRLQLLQSRSNQTADQYEARIIPNRIRISRKRTMLS